jgi:hypothetical protein
MEEFTVLKWFLKLAHPGYKGLLLSSCKNVPLFQRCQRDHREFNRTKISYRNFYGVNKVVQEWSTFDKFDVFDCSDVQDKWGFFTGHECGDSWCRLKTSCQGFLCICCEEIRYDLKPTDEIILLKANYKFQITSNWGYFIFPYKLFILF